jgi:signal peptidase I
MTEHEPRPPLEPVRWEDEDALFDQQGDGSRDGWPYVPPPTESESDRLERERRERARHSRNPVIRLTAGLPRTARVTIDWAITIVGAIAIVLAIKAWVVNPYRIPSSSMEPTLHCARPESGCESRFSDRVLANRFVYHLREPKRGDIVVFETPKSALAKCGAGGTFVKRLVALPGETWEERDGVVFINGKRLVEPYVHPNRRDSNTYGPRKIPEGRYFFMGDNRGQSCDSREWGAVPRENIIGEVFFVYWPPMRIGFRTALVLLGFIVILPLARVRFR